MRATVFIILGVVSITVLACSDSTASRPLDLAKHVDSLFMDASRRGSAGSMGYRARSGFVGEAELPIAYGAVPVEIDVTTARGVERWSGVEFKSLSTIIPGDGFGTWIDLYRGNAMHTMLVAYFHRDGALNAAELLVNDTVVVDPADAFGVTVESSSGTDCVVAEGLENPDVARFFSTPCTLEEFRSSFSGDFPIPSNVDPELRSLSFDYTTLNGVFITGS